MCFLAQMFQQSSLSFFFPKFRQRQSPLLLAGGVLTGHALGNIWSTPWQTRGSPRALKVDSTDELDVPWAQWTGPLSSGGPRAAGLCVYLLEGLAAPSTASLGTGKWGGG